MNSERLPNIEDRKYLDTKDLPSNGHVLTKAQFDNGEKNTKNCHVDFINPGKWTLVKKDVLVTYVGKDLPNVGQKMMTARRDCNDDKKWWCIIGAGYGPDNK